MKIIIIGGAGFIGINAANYFSEKNSVTIFDNLSRKGAKGNILWLKKKKNIVFIKGDIKKQNKQLDNVIKNSDIILHLAGQVAVTTSVLNPREDFEINALGTFNVLESVRKSGNNPILIY